MSNDTSQRIRLRHHALAASLAMALCLPVGAQVVVTPKPGSSFEIHALGGTPVLKVEEAGRVLVPGLSAAADGDTVLCFDAVSGALGPCAAGSVVGPAGPAGPTGPTGAIGPPGPSGAIGAIGPTGAAGPMGPAGATGAIGPAGPVGATGDAGPAGPIGATGATGATGAAATMTRYHVYGTAGRLAVASAVATVQPGLTQTFTLGSPATVTIWATIGARTTGTGNANYATVDAVVYVDGNFLPSGGWNRFSVVNPSTTNAFNAVAINTMVALPAGTHTVDLRTLRLAGSTSTVDIGGNASADVNPGELTIVVFDGAPVTPIVTADSPRRVRN